MIYHSDPLRSPSLTNTPSLRSWGLTRAPPELVEELRNVLHAGLATAKPEKEVDVIFGGEDSRPLFVQNGILNGKALEVLRPMHEEWAGVPLKGATAYGLRAYRNSSSLQMHIDKSGTHIISCILHVDHSEDSKPWPIVIEGLDDLLKLDATTLRSADVVIVCCELLYNRAQGQGPGAYQEHLVSKAGCDALPTFLQGRRSAEPAP